MALKLQTHKEVRSNFENNLTRKGISEPYALSGVAAPSQGLLAKAVLGGNNVIALTHSALL